MVFSCVYDTLWSYLLSCLFLSLLPLFHITNGNPCNLMSSFLFGLHIWEKIWDSYLFETGLFKMIISSSTHFPASDICSFLFKHSFIVYTTACLLIHLLMTRWKPRLFQNSVIVTNAAKNGYASVSLVSFESFWYMLRTGVTEWHGSSSSGPSYCLP